MKELSKLSKMSKFKTMGSGSDKNDKVRFNVTMEKWLWYQLKIQSVKSGYSMKSIINAAIEDMLLAIKQNEEPVAVSGEELKEVKIKLAKKTKEIIHNV